MDAAELHIFTLLFILRMTACQDSADISKTSKIIIRAEIPFASSLSFGIAIFIYATYQGFSARLIDAMIESGYSARAGSWSRFPVEIEPLRREAGAKSLTTARKDLEGSAFPRRYRLELIADWLRVNTEWLASGNGPRYAGTAAYTGPDLPEEALALAKAWAALPRYYR